MTKATNSAVMRQRNEKIILSLINREPLSRAEIAKKTGLTKAAVTIIVEDLVKRGFVSEENVKVNSVGRNPVMLYLNGDSCYMIGINITRRDITVGICNLCGECVIEETFDVIPPEKAWKKIADVIEKQLETKDIKREKVYKISVATPGPVNAEKGIILNPVNFKGWEGVKVVEEIKKSTGIDAVFDNISATTALSEMYFGVAVGTNNFMALLVDEGIGSGIVTGGNLFTGPSELGHISIKLDGVLCDCGNRGCLERYASIPELLKNTRYNSWRELADSGDDVIIKKEAEYLSAAIINVNNLFNLDKVVLCGNLTYKPERLIELISETIGDNLLIKQKFEICAGKIKSKSLLAAAKAIDDFFSI